MVTRRGFKNQGRPIPQRYLAPGGSDHRETSDSGRHPIPRWYRREVGEASNEKAAISGSLKLGGRAKLLGAVIPEWYRREAGEASNEKAAISSGLKLEGRVELGWSLGNCEDRLLAQTAKLL